MDAAAPRPEARRTASREESLACYLKLGMARSLPKVVDELASRGIIANHGTLKAWSSKHDWAVKAREFDRRRTADLQGEVARMMVTRVTDVCGQMLEVAEKLLIKAGNLVNKEEAAQPCINMAMKITSHVADLMPKVDEAPTPAGEDITKQGDSVDSLFASMGSGGVATIPGSVQ